MRVLASAGRAACRSSPPLTTALSPHTRARSSTSRRSCRSSKGRACARRGRRGRDRRRVADRSAAAAAAAACGGGRAGADGRTGVQGAEDSAVGRLLLVVAVEWKSVTGALEGVGHPGVLVGQTPGGDAEALGCEGTGLDNVAVVGSLLLKLAAVGWQVHADVKLGVGDIDAKVGEGLEVGLILRVRGHLTDNKMGLQTNAYSMT